jgi:poly-gamma-glutamate capsule biosynthesis protein CapA/YwtB (metallophosphatase superfamily)
VPLGCSGRRRAHPAARRLAGALLVLVAACARQPATPVPGPDNAAARRDSVERALRAARAADSVARERKRDRERRDAALVRICAGGDVTLGTNLDTSWARYASRKLKRPVAALPSPDSLLIPLRPLVADAEVLLLNVEGAVGEGASSIDKCANTTSGCYALRMPLAAADAIRRVNMNAVVVANLANNHARDAGTDGLDETVRALRDAGVVVTGLDTLATVVTTAAGDSVAILGFSTSTELTDLRDLAAVKRHVARAAASHRRVVVTMHLGAEGVTAQRTRDSTETFMNGSRGNPVAFARASTDAGAQLVIGHGPHVVRAVEWRNGALVLYSLGNLVTYGPFSHREPMRRGAVACATVDGKGGVHDAVMRATMQRAPGRMSPDRGRRALRIADSLSKLDFPKTGARIARDGTVRRR